MLHERNVEQHILYSPDHDVIGILEEIASECLSSTHFFHSAPEPYANALRRPERTHRRRPLIQHGIIRTNCVDCLDRTNAAQFIVGKCAFVHQLHALGLIAEPRLSFDCGAIKTLMEMYHDHG